MFHGALKLDGGLLSSLATVDIHETNMDCTSLRITRPDCV